MSADTAVSGQRGRPTGREHSDGDGDRCGPRRRRAMDPRDRRNRTSVHDWLTARAARATRQGWTSARRRIASTAASRPRHVGRRTRRRFPGIESRGGRRLCMN